MDPLYAVLVLKTNDDSLQIISLLTMTPPVQVSYNQYLCPGTVPPNEYTNHICYPWYMSLDTMACKPIKVQELQYIMYYFQNESECFIGVSKHRETNESTRPKAECF